MIAGDAAGFVFSNGLVIQGMNYAIRTGIEAAEVALGAKASGDASSNRLSEYTRRLEQTGVLHDFREFEGMDRVKWNPRFYSVYPRMAAEVFRGLLTAGDAPGAPLLRLMRQAQKELGVSTVELARDTLDALRNL